jgi:TPR repeat protein
MMRFLRQNVRQWLAARARDEKSAATLRARGFDADAFQIYARRAQGGDADAQFQVALAYLEGRGIPASRVEAMRWLERAATQGHTDAKVLLATLLLQGGVSEDLGIGAEQPHGPDFVTAEKWARAAALRGHAEAQAVLAHILSVGPRRNLDEAHLWYERAAAAGSANGMFGLAISLAGRSSDPASKVRVNQLAQDAANAGHIGAARALGQMYWRGTGVPRDLAMAAHWLRTAASAGDREAQSELGNLLMSAEAVEFPEALAEVRRWFAQAATAGDPVAQLNIGLCLIQGVGGARDETRGLRWLRDAAQQLANGQYWVGRMLVQGRGAPADPVDGRAWITRAAEAGLADAEFALAEMMVHGIGGATDHVCAVSLLERAVAKNHVSAMYALGAMKSGGYDVPVDLHGAHVLFTRAADLGHAEAKALLAKKHAAE